MAKRRPGRQSVPGAAPKTPSRTGATTPTSAPPTATPRAGTNQFEARLPQYIEDYNRYVKQGLAAAIPAGLSPQQAYEWTLHEAYKKGGLFYQARAVGYQPGTGTPADVLLKGGGGSYPSEFVSWVGSQFEGLSDQSKQDFWNRWLNTFAGKTWTQKHPGEDPPTGGGTGGGGSPGDGGADGGGGTGGGSGSGDGQGGGSGGGGAQTPEQTKHQNDLFSQFKQTLAEFGLTGLDDFIKLAVKEDWSDSTFLIKLRQENAYLANPLFAANLENAKKGGVFRPEGQVIAYGAEVKRLAKQFGFKEPSDSYVAAGLLSGLSMAEIEHRFQVQDRVNQYGAGVSLVYKQLMGVDPSDQDLFEIFDKEHSTKEFDDAARRAEMRGRPFTLGLGIRSEEEARALEMLGVSPDEAFSRYETLGANQSRFERLRSIEDLITKGWPDDFGGFMKDVPNDLLRDALIYQRPDALAEIQAITAREAARNNAGGGVVGDQGVLTGLLAAGQS